MVTESSRKLFKAVYRPGYHLFYDVGELTLGWLDHPTGTDEACDEACNGAEELLPQ